MSISVGVSSTAKKVKRIYVGVDGVAKPVSEVYCGNSDGVAKSVYKDNNSKFDVVRIVSANQLVCVHRNANESDVYITAITRQPVLTQYKYTESKELSKLSNAIGLTNVPSNLNPSRDTPAYNNICFGTASKRVSDSPDDFVFSFSLDTNIKTTGMGSVRRINPVEMVELAATGDSNSPILSFDNIPVAGSAYLTYYRPFYIPTSDAFARPTPPKFHFVAQDRACVGVFDGTNVIESAPLDDIPLDKTNLSYVSNSYEVSPTAVNRPLQYLTSHGVYDEEWDYTRHYLSLGYLIVGADGATSVAHKIVLPDMQVDANFKYSVGAAIHTYVWLQDGTQGQAYANTINYVYQNKKHSMLVVDNTLVLSQGVLPETFDTHTYQESESLHEDGLIAEENYGWFVLGSDSNYIYVLSTLSETYKILAFKKDFRNGNGFYKEYEFDTGHKITSDKTLCEITPVIYNGTEAAEQEKTKFTLMPSFMLVGEEKVGATLTNVGYVFIVPRHIICSDANKVQ